MLFPQEAREAPPAAVYPPPPEPKPAGLDKRSLLVGVGVAVAAVYVVVSLYMIFDLRSKVAGLETKQQAMLAEQVGLNNRLATASSQFRQELSSEVGLTKQQLAERTAQLESEQKAAAA